MIAPEAKSAEIELVRYCLLTMFEESLEDILRILFHTTVSGIRLLEYIAVEQVMLDQIRNDVIERTTKRI